MSTPRCPQSPRLCGSDDAALASGAGAAAFPTLPITSCPRTVCPDPTQCPPIPTLCPDHPTICPPNPTSCPQIPTVCAHCDAAYAPDAGGVAFPPLPPTPCPTTICPGEGCLP